MKRIRLSFFLLLFLTNVCHAQQVQVDGQEVLRDVQTLASDALEGRKTGTSGNRLAQQFIEDRFESLGLKTFGGSYRHPFDHTNPDTDEHFEGAVNLIGYVEGSKNPDRYLVVSAHYDHLGVIDGEIYNGADDNTSGTAALMAAARWFSGHPPKNSILFIAFDAEEQGLGGSLHFVEHPVVPLDQIVLNVNLDMISISPDNELYAAGTSHYGFLKPMAEESVREAPVDVLFGYDSPGPDPATDWTLASDHGPFHLQGIPFIYFGVEDHAHYHQPTDTFEHIHPDFYLDAVLTILRFIRDIDCRLDELREASGR